MEIKYTIEILTKDIQDIEKLVRNLNNSATPPKIELDLALSKLRHVYELLTMIRADNLEELSREQKVSVQKEETASVNEQKEETLFDNKDGHTAIDEKDESSITQEEIENQAAEETIKARIVEEKLDSPVSVKHEGSPAEIQEEYSAPETEAHYSAPEKDTTVILEERKESQPAEEKPAVSQPEEPEIFDQPDDQPSPADQNAEAPAKKRDASILGERFQNDRSINDNMASTKQQSNVTSKISSQPIDLIGRNIGINDRFLIIRELFEGDNDSFTQFIKTLDEAGSESGASSILKGKFSEHADHEGYQLLETLIRRKYLS